MQTSLYLEKCFPYLRLQYAQAPVITQSHWARIHCYLNVSSFSTSFYGCFLTHGVILAFHAYFAFTNSISYFNWMNEFAAINLGLKSFLTGLDSYCRAAAGMAFGLARTRCREAQIVRCEFRSLKSERLINFFFNKELVLTVVGILLSQWVSLYIMF